MNLDPLTFSFEIFNFLVLIWLLHRFLYKPIQNAIQRRKLDLEQEWKNVKAQQSRAEQLEKKLKEKATLWNEEKRQQESQLKHSLAKEQQLALSKLNDELQSERKKRESILLHEREEFTREIKQQAAATALNLSKQFLLRLASEELDHCLLNLLREDLATLSQSKRTELIKNIKSQSGAVTILSARSLNRNELSDLEKSLQSLCDTPLDLTTKLETTLIAGVRVIIGDQVLHANLGDELEFFRSGLVNETN